MQLAFGILLQSDLITGQWVTLSQSLPAVPKQLTVKGWGGSLSIMLHRM